MKKTGICNTYNIEEIRADFPLLRANPKLAYLDNSATSQRPECVLRAVMDFYEKSNANPLRGLYDLAQNATEAYEAAREVVRDFLNARSAEEIVFTRNATEALNLVAYSYGGMVLQPGDEILVSVMEHHSNLLPWQQAAHRMGAVLQYVECDRDGRLTEERFRAALTDRTRIAAVTHVSNVLGWKNDISAFARACHARNIALVVDGAQSVPHMPVDVQALGADFLAFSGHKLLSPMGIGVLYGKREHLMAMPPFLTGGEMIDSVSRYDASFAELPHKFEAGTVNAGGAVGLAAAITYIRNLGFDYIEERENALTRLAMEELQKIPFVHILGSDQAAEHHGILSFTVEGVHPHDVAAILDAEQIAVRAGHHCAQPLHQYLGVMSSTRASIAFYNTEDEIRRLAGCLSEIRRKMGYAE